MTEKKPMKIRNKNDSSEVFKSINFHNHYSDGVSIAEKAPSHFMRMSLHSPYKLEQHFSLWNNKEHAFFGMEYCKYTLQIWHSEYSIYAKFQTNETRKNIEPKFIM